MSDHHPGPRTDEDDTRVLTLVMHAAFAVLLAASLARYLARHAAEPRTPWVVALTALLALLYVLGPALGRVGTAPPATRPPTRVRPRPATSTHPTHRTHRTHPTPPGPPSRRTTGLRRAPAPGVRLTHLTRLARLAWLGPTVAAWAVLVLLAPSYAWCAVPLFYAGLRSFPPRTAIPLVVVLTALAVAAQLRLAGWPDPNVLLAPPAVAAVATTVYVVTQRQTARRAVLIDDLVRTRRELAATERREGTLAERERLAREIHDTLAQGLSSQRMLLQAADRLWDTAPDTARDHVRTAGAIAERSLAEARRFVHDLTPADLAEGGGLARALDALAARETTPALTVEVRTDGTPTPLPAAVESALLRIAQGALANVREHAAATTATLTLTCLDDQVVLDITDNGRGFPAHGGHTNENPAPDGRTPEDPAVRDGVPPEVPAVRDERTPDGPVRGTVGTLGTDDSAARGHGLPAARARLRQLGGTLTIESTPGEGTVLSASIPLEPR
ncbi:MULTISPECIES: sensor histidine kinase [unclassified Streptomyces]|uniref:sensor histidine kinase n=1 Tax=unclassified Streptomyces TaxID=2593676 RepID=UPI00381C8EDE